MKWIAVSFLFASLAFAGVTTSPETSKQISKRVAQGMAIAVTTRYRYDYLFTQQKCVFELARDFFYEAILPRVEALPAEEIAGMAAHIDDLMNLTILSILKPRANTDSQLHAVHYLQLLPSIDFSRLDALVHEKCHLAAHPEGRFTYQEITSLVLNQQSAHHSALR